MRSRLLGSAFFSLMLGAMGGIGGDVPILHDTDTPLPRGKGKTGGRKIQRQAKKKRNKRK